MYLFFICRTLCGTPNYIAPEILNKKGHSFEVDVWSIGCIMWVFSSFSLLKNPVVLFLKAFFYTLTYFLIFQSFRYTLLVGRPPFETNSLKETYERIKRCDYRLPSAMKPAAATLIHKMLQPDPKKRPTVREILNSEFFDGIYFVLCLIIKYFIWTA